MAGTFYVGLAVDWVLNEFNYYDSEWGIPQGESVKFLVLYWGKLYLM